MVKKPSFGPQILLSIVLEVLNFEKKIKITNAKISLFSDGARKKGKIFDFLKKFSFSQKFVYSYLRLTINEY